MMRVRPDLASPLPAVYVVDGSIAVTGAFVCARNIARALSGIAQVILVLPVNSTIGSEDTAPFAAVYRLPIRPLRRRISAVIEYFPALVVASFWLRWLMWRDRASVMIINDFYNMHGAVCRLLGFRGRLLTWVRIAPTVFGTKISGFWLRGAALSSDHVVAVSRHIQRLLPERLHTTILYDAIDPSPDAQPDDASADRFIYVGNYIAGKGQDYAIEAFSALVDDFPHLSLHFYGGDMGLPRNSAYRQALSEQVRKLGLQERIFLHGFARDSSIALRGALAALNFSASEAFSMTVLEAQGAGVPVVSTRSGGPEEIVADAATGFLVPVGDVAAMTSAMRIIAEDPKRAKNMGFAARERVNSLFSPSIFRDKLLSLIGIHVN